ncbi:MAG TPA: phospholipase A [Xanthomonadaceae bacterium]|nr:phospholipase A [Xanthomonadaceae bacterium]
MKIAPALLLLAGAAAAHAQELPAPSPAEACVQVENDVERLACYDRALGRGTVDPRQADRAAEAAQALREALDQARTVPPDAVPATAPARASDLYPDDDPLAAALANAGRGSLLDSRWELAKGSKLGTFNFRAYKPVYLLPAFWSSEPNTLPTSPNPRNTVTEPQALNDVEAKFQLSFKTKALENVFGDNGDVWMAYTQDSHWQVYNAGESRPFRETDYEPEVLLVFRTRYRVAGWTGRLLGVGLNHQSNGRADPLSRSWNRIMLNVGFDRDGWSLMLRPWWRVPDGDDDNPDIADYAGRGDVTLVHHRGDQEFALVARHSLRGGDRSHGALQFDWAFPLTRSLRGHVQVFDGYGESLIDYNHRATYVGVGVSLLEWY